MKTERVALYLRVSTTGQTVENQRQELLAVAKRHGWDVVAEFKDAGLSGSKGRDKRPGLDKLLKAVTRREFDKVAVWSVDRLGRSLQDLLGTLAELHASHVGLYLHQQAVDTSTPAGRALFQMMGVFAEFERSIIVERVHAGLRRAKADGTTLGRPTLGHEKNAAKRAANAGKESKIRTLRAKGKGILAIAREVGCGTSVVQRVIAAA